MAFHLWLSLATICLLGAMSPGPSLALIIKNTLNGGAKQGYATAISHGLAVTLYATFTLMGIGLVIIQSPQLFQFIQYAGAAFLLYLAIKSFTSSHPSIDRQNQSNNKPITTNGWRDGFLIAFLNPKLAIFFLALFSQFIKVDANLIEQITMITTAGLIDMLWYLLLAFLLSRGIILNKLKANAQLIEKIMGCCLVLLALRIVFQ